jgi:hypothetical protein
MKPSVFVIVFAFVSLEGEAAPMDFFYGGEAPPYSSNGAESTGSRPHPRGYGNGGRISDVPRTVPPARREGRFWVPAPDQTPESRDFDPYSIDARDSYRYPASEASLYDQFRPRHEDIVQSWTHQEQRRPVGYGSYSNGFEPRYRFRDDKRLDNLPWSETSWHRGYRFRPLTEQERERRRSDAAWRRPAPVRAGDPYPNVPRDVPVDEAYGYQPDSWFQRYYGDRP